MNKTLVSSAVCALLAGSLVSLLCSCASTSVTQTWKSPELRQPVGKIAVITVDQRGLLRKALENRFVSQLSGMGTPAMVTYDRLSLNEIKEDKRAAAKVFQENGAETVLIVRLINADTIQRETRPGGERYAATITGFDTFGWYDYYSIGFTDMSPTYSSTKQKLFLETTLYDLKSEKRVWAVVTRTVLTETMDRLAEADPLVEKIVLNMRKDGVIR